MDDVGAVRGADQGGRRRHGAAGDGGNELQEQWMKHLDVDSMMEQLRRELGPDNAQPAAATGKILKGQLRQMAQNQ